MGLGQEGSFGTTDIAKIFHPELFAFKSKNGDIREVGWCVCFILLLWSCWFDLRQNVCPRYGSLTRMFLFHDYYSGSNNKPFSRNYWRHYGASLVVVALSSMAKSSWITMTYQYKFSKSDLSQWSAFCDDGPSFVLAKPWSAMLQPRRFISSESQRANICLSLT